MFTMIVLGEVVVGVVDGLVHGTRDAHTIATGLVALVVGFGLWWNYFDFTAKRLQRPAPTGEPVWVALHLPLTLSIAATGAALVTLIEHAGDLLAIYQDEIGLSDTDDIIAYCRIGERSSHTWFVLTHLLGYPSVRNYDGSWTEWGNLVRAPIEK